MSHLLIFIGIFAGLMLLPVIWRLTLATWSSVFQLYTLPVLGFYPAFALLSTLSLGPKFLTQYKRVFTQTPLLILIALMGVQTISLIWSPNRTLGMATILYETPFLILYIISFSIALTDPSKLFNIVKVYAVLSLVPLLVMLACSVDHSFDPRFLKSFFAKLVINPKTLSWYFTQPGHDEWPGKPNGFFTNQNVGAGYLGICALLFWGAGIYYRRSWIKSIAVVHWLTLFLSFSVSAIGLAISVPLSLMLIYILTEKSITFSIKNSTLFKYFLVGCASLLLFIIETSDLFNLILYKFQSRLVFWKTAIALLPNHLLLGLGFGGWDISYEQYRQSVPFNPLLAANLPPHNTFIGLWSQSGIIAAILGLFFMISTLWLCWRTFKSFTTSHKKLFSLCVMGGFIWVFLQGMGENWGVIGEMHIQPILAILFGLMMGLSCRKPTEESH